MFFRSTLLFLIASCAAPLRAAAKDVYVSKQGDDANAGTQAAPVEHIADKSGQTCTT